MTANLITTVYMESMELDGDTQSDDDIDSVYGMESMELNRDTLSGDDTNSLY